MRYETILGKFGKEHRVGLLAYWLIGLLAYWLIGLLAYWLIGLLAYWLIVDSSTDILLYRNANS